MLVVGLVATLLGIAMPQIFEALRRYRTFSAAREVAGQIRSARLAAVTTNRVMVVRFNCPAAGQYRFLEVTGNPAIDNAANRCAFPFPDPDPNVLPNNDGAPRMLPDTIVFGATQDLRIGTTGLITPVLGGTPAQIQVVNGGLIGLVTASTAGRVRVQ